MFRSPAEALAATRYASEAELLAALRPEVLERVKDCAGACISLGNEAVALLQREAERLSMTERERDATGAVLGCVWAGLLTATPQEKEAVDTLLQKVLRPERRGLFRFLRRNDKR